ncbi:MAG TPA: hypothetical protein ENK11_09035 [Phycisphaerales bacterium]|nr:hypothetical protein [Phycisphaerales bacterium]
MNGIRPEHDPELTGKVRALYLFIYKELFESSFEKDIARLDKVIELLEYERETWVLLMQKLAEEGGRQNAVNGADGGVSSETGGERKSLSIQA